MALPLVIALCVYADSFRFISDSPFEGEWKASAVCTGLLTMELGVLLWRSRQTRSPLQRKLLVIVAASGLGVAGLAVFAGWHATQGLPCFGNPESHPTAAQAQQADALYQTLTIIDTLAVLACVVTVVLVIMGAVRLVRSKA